MVPISLKQLRPRKKIIILVSRQVAFEKQRMEIAALHAAEEKAVAKTSQVRRELGGSEKELCALEREMTEIGTLFHSVIR